MSHCRHPGSPVACLCAWPGITPGEYADLLEVRRAQHVAAYEAGAAMSADPDAAHRMADYFKGAPAHVFWAEGDPQSKVTRTPAETPGQRKARIRSSRIRRLETVQARIAAYEAAHPDTTLGPSVASNNWRHRQARVNTEIDAAAQYEKDQKTAQHLVGLLAKENAS